jgi:GT2 family glycosyltransferase
MSPRPTLAELPPAPAGRSGWPWTEAPPPPPPTLSGGRPWPRITVVTPSYRQAEFLEATLRSVLLQGYPDLEYIVVDGGSDDGSVEILERYSPWLHAWSSEPDRGQSHAINKGFRRATGEILAWLNSDDLYYPGALETVARLFDRTGCDLLFGAMDKVEVTPTGVRPVKRSTPLDGEPIHPFPILANGRWHRFHFIQPPMFWRRWVWERTGGLDERYHYVMDREWCNRALALGAEPVVTDAVLARFALHPGSKSRERGPLFSRELALMYLRLSRIPGFRPGPCLVAATRPAQRALARGAAVATAEGRRGAALLLRLGAHALSNARRIAPGRWTGTERRRGRERDTTRSHASTSPVARGATPPSTTRR